MGEKFSTNTTSYLRDKRASVCSFSEINTRIQEKQDKLTLGQLVMKIPDVPCSFLTGKHEVFSYSVTYIAVRLTVDL